MLTVTSTEDVSVATLRAFGSDLPPEIELAVDDSQICMRSLEPPSWMILHAGTEWWQAVIGGCAALYVAEIVKEAAKETWKNRTSAIAAVAGTGNLLWRFAASIAKLREHLRPATDIRVAIPVPDSFWSTSLLLHGRDPDMITCQLALFIHHLPALKTLINEHGLNSGGAAAGVYLQLNDDGALEVRWQDGDTLAPRKEEIPFC